MLRSAVYLGIILLAAVIWLTGAAANVYATEEYAAATGRECGVCHVDPLGGGALTDLGKGYLLSISAAGSEKPTGRKAVSVMMRRVARYLHIVTAFLWFGTILYVHIILKPAYASKGLPPGEVRVGLVSMAVMAVTGSVLAYYKIPDAGLLLTTRFGILLLVKIALFGVMVSTGLFAVFVIGPKLKKKQASSISESGEYTLTRLAGFDGDADSLAFIAYQGKVYDVSKSPLWKKGTHMQRHRAGNDLTHMLQQAPHGEEKVLAMPEVGRLTEAREGTQKPRYQGPFFFLAYLNLAVVFVILFVLALWRG